MFNRRKRELSQSEFFVESLPSKPKRKSSSREIPAAGIIVPRRQISEISHFADLKSVDLRGKPVLPLGRRIHHIAAPVTLIAIIKRQTMTARTFVGRPKIEPI